MREYPPILSGPVENQVAAIRDYLVRLAKVIDDPSQSGSSVGSLSALSQELQRTASSLRSIIQVTDLKLQKGILDLEQEVQRDYVTSEYLGQYQDTVSDRFATDEDVITSLVSFRTDIKTQIGRGVISDSGTDVHGIVVADEIRYSGGTPYVDPYGNEYGRLAQDFDFVLHTESGTQFWHDGVKVAWFDGKFHIGSWSFDASSQAIGLSLGNATKMNVDSSSSELAVPSGWKLKIGSTTLNESQLIALLALL